MPGFRKEFNMRVVYFKKELLVALLIILMLLLIVLIIKSTDRKDSVEAVFVFPLLGRSLVIDPGHGGYDPGVTGHGVIEKDVVLEISRYMKLLLQKKGARVIMTREVDDDLLELPAGPKKRADLTNRLKIIEGSDVEIMVSIHANAIESPVWSGSQTFYNSDEDEDSRLLALLIQEELISVLKNTNRHAKPGNFFILQNSPVPSAIVEVGFLSNPEESKLLQDPEYQKKVAYAVSRGIFRYFEEQ